MRQAPSAERSGDLKTPGSLFKQALSPSGSRGFINPASLQDFPRADFKHKDPYPWHVFHRLLTSEGFSKLYLNFPALESFEKHEDLERGYGQRPHNRFYLAYQNSPYHSKEYHGKGVIQYEELPSAWQRFLEELEGKAYQDVVKSVFGTSDFQTRYAWHVSVSDSEVCPHLDDGTKLGLHNFYFNTSEDWQEAWGGHTWVLGGLKRKTKNPDFSDFSVATPLPFLDNRSFFFRNSPAAWHGVQTLASPSGKYRRLFSIIFEVLENKPKNRLREWFRSFTGQKKYPGMR